MRLDVALMDVLSGVREEDPEALEGLMRSIRDVGLLHPPVVVGNPELPGRYIVISGRRRVAAWRRLGKVKINCKLLAKFDPLRNEMIEITENFHRLELTRQERDAAVIRYANLVRQKVAQEEAKVAEAARVEESRLPEPRRSQEDATALVAANGALRHAKAREGAVVNAIVDNMGVNRRTAQRILRRADVFDDTQRDALIRAGVTDGRMDRIASIPDPEKRAMVVDGLRAGLSYVDAMTEVLADEFVIDESSLSDEEFLATLPLSTDAVNQHRFRADALFYRKVQKLRLAFVRDLEWARVKQEFNMAGIYYRRAKLFLDAPHPREWLRCSDCTAGVVGGMEHRPCMGGGYLIGG